MNQRLKRTLGSLLDIPLSAAAIAMSPFAVLMSRLGHMAPRSRAILDWAGVGVVRHHYYQPLVFPSDLQLHSRAERAISGLDLNESGQIALLKQFHYQSELQAIPLTRAGSNEFFYQNASFESGDAEYLYNMIRHFKPKRIVEIGSGNSTLLARRALQKNREENPAYSCEHVCIEPYEQPWLENTGATIIRKKVEDCPFDLFDSLRENDILFIDSSHCIRPQGDVVHEYLHVLGRLAPGVVIHIHDIFTPFDYPADWLIKDRRMWDEQYLMEAFLCFNTSFEVIGAVNWLNHTHRDILSEACPLLVQQPGREPGSFWLRRTLAGG
jgi:Methyltransferase domain